MWRTAEQARGYQAYPAEMDFEAGPGAGETQSERTLDQPDDSDEEDPAGPVPDLQQLVASEERTWSRSRQASPRS